MGRLIFIDQSRINLDGGPNYSLAPAGQPATIIGRRPKHWEPRVDFMGAVSGRRLLAFETKSPQERKAAGVKGWTKAMVLAFVREQLAPAVTEAELSGVTIVMDKALRITPEEVKSEMKEGGVDDVREVVILPTGSAKYVSPLDNTLWHELKQRVRARSTPTVEAAITALEQEWNAIPTASLGNSYRHCALTRGSDAFAGRS